MDVSLTLTSGDAASIVGPSGSGKSTLLYILGALEPPSAGSVALDGVTRLGYRQLNWLSSGIVGSGLYSRIICFYPNALSLRMF